MAHENNKNKKNTIQEIPTRAQVSIEDTWDLTVLFASRKDWEVAKTELLAMLPSVTAYEGTLKEDAAYILEFLQTSTKVSEKAEHIFSYAYLQYYADASSTEGQELVGICGALTAQIAPALAFVDEELSSLSEGFLQAIRDDSAFSDYKQHITQLIRRKKHILSKAEEKLLAHQAEYNSGISKAFSSLTDIDMSYGEINTPEGKVALTQSSVGVLLEHNDRIVRKTAYEQFMTEYKEHINTLAILYASSVQKDNAMAKIRKYKNALDAELYEDNVPHSLYHKLIKIVHENLPLLHRYYALLKKQMGLEDYAVYDLSAKPYASPTHYMSYEEAVELVCAACAPLGEEYTHIMHKGLTEARWVDRYENQGKRSGAFSMGVYGAYPYIMMNYKPESLRHVFTLAHEAGHSMHSYFASRKNSFAQHDYTIFEAEVASTVNEFLTYRHLIAASKRTDTQMKTYLLWHEIQDFIGTFFRQTMFAEFELLAHTYSEEGKPLTVEYFTELSKKLLHQYYGDAVHVPELSNVIGLRIPHFYRNFYVYKYATGIAAAVDIGTRIYHKEANAVSNYFKFLESGSSQFPIDALKLAGVDYNNTTALTNAMKEFERKITLLESLSK